MDSFFDFKKPYLHSSYLSIISLILIVNRSNPQSNLLIFINVILYLIITSSIFFFYSINEQKRILELYYKEYLGYQHEFNNKKFLTYQKDVRKNYIPTKNNKPFVYLFSTFFLCLIFIFISLFYYFVNFNKIKIRSVLKLSFFLFSLGLTEMFIAFKVMYNMPYPDIFNILDIVSSKNS